MCVCVKSVECVCVSGVCVCVCVECGGVTSALLCFPSERLSPAQCHAHPWLATQSPKASTKLSTAKLKTYVASRKWQVSNHYSTLYIRVARYLYYKQCRSCSPVC